MTNTIPEPTPEQFPSDVEYNLSFMIHFSDWRNDVGPFTNPRHEVAQAASYLVRLSKGDLGEPRLLPERLVRYVSWLQDQAREKRKDGFVPDNSDHGTDVWAVREFGRMFGCCFVKKGHVTWIRLPNYLYYPEGVMPFEMLDAETLRRLEEEWAATKLSDDRVMA